jgi:hypothetical protein
MRPHLVGGWVLALMLGAATSAAAQGSDHDREACTPDVFRLCGAYVPDVDRITACLRGNCPRLSRPCYDVFFPPQEIPQDLRQQDSRRQNIDPRRRYQAPAQRPDDDED